jgi:PTH1 family peptidyl-tRNA hydrolase
VFHDELDLAPGRVRVKRGGGHAGHNGLRSLHQHIGDAYRRVRIGIGHPGRKDLVSAYVLHDFAAADAEWLDDVLRGIGDGAAHLAGGEDGRFMNAVALRAQPARQEPAPPPAPVPAPVPAPAPAEERPAASPEPAQVRETTEDARSPLQRLVDRFR